MSGIQAQSKPTIGITVTDNGADNSLGYRFAITMDADDANQQRIYDWAYRQFGHDAKRWSISGTETFYVAYETDANLLKEKFDGAAQK